MRIGAPNESAAAVRSSTRNRRFGFLFNPYGEEIMKGRQDKSLKKWVSQTGEKLKSLVKEHKICWEVLPKQIPVKDGVHVVVAITAAAHPANVYLHQMVSAYGTLDNALRLPTLHQVTPRTIHRQHHQQLRKNHNICSLERVIFPLDHFVVYLIKQTGQNLEK